VPGTTQAGGGLERGGHDAARISAEQYVSVPGAVVGIPPRLDACVPGVQTLPDLVRLVRPPLTLAPRDQCSGRRDPHEAGRPEDLEPLPATRCHTHNDRPTATAALAGSEPLASPPYRWPPRSTAPVPATCGCSAVARPPTGSSRHSPTHR